MTSVFDQPSICSQDDFDTDPKRWDVIIVGAGIAGSTLAAVQGELNRRVLVIERDLSQPNRIVGELLQPGGFEKLKELGLGEAVEGIDATKVCGYGIFKDGKSTVLKYPKGREDEQMTGRSFHHGRFVQRLRQLVQSKPSITLRQGVVKSLINNDGKDFTEEEVVCGIRYKCNGTDHCAYGYLTIVCDGMYSSLRKSFLSPSIKHPSYFVGLILQNCSLPFPNHGHVVLAKPSPLLFYPISSYEVRCLVDIQGDRLPSQSSGDLSTYLLQVVAFEVPTELRQAFIEAVKHGEIRSVQNKQMSASPVHHNGALIIGDAYNMRHPLTGGGMTVALADCKVLCDMLSVHHSFQDVALVQETTSAFHLHRKPLSCTINTLANALYKVFVYTGDEAHEQMRQACFDYLSQGGICASGPISLLSGLNPRPMVLVVHFFLVALFGIRQVMWPFSLRSIGMSCRLLADAIGIIFPIVKDEGWNMLWSELFTPNDSHTFSQARQNKKSHMD
eukprot:g6224.t1